jgi:hypothetical protein
MLTRLISLLGADMIASLIDKGWLNFLLGTGTSFTIRIKYNNLVLNVKGILKPVKNFFKELPLGTS